MSGRCSGVLSPKNTRQRDWFLCWERGKDAKYTVMKDPAMIAFDRLLAEWAKTVAIGAPDVEQIKRLARANEEFERVYCPGGRNA